MNSLIANFVANIKLGYKTKKLNILCYPNKFVLRVIQKFIIQGLIRGFKFNKKFILVYLKYDNNFSPVLVHIKLISSSGHRVYFTFKQVNDAYFMNKTYLLTTNKGLFFINEIILNNLHLGGEVIIKIDYL